MKFRYRESPLGSKVKDLTGSVNGEREVIQHLGLRADSSATHRYWLVKCSCGRLDELPTHRVISRPHCGCKHRIYPDVKKGSIYGRLEVLSVSNNRASCVCACETLTEVHLGDLKSGHTKSCGCLAKENLVFRSTTHGLCKNHLAEMNIRYHMISRCINPEDGGYSNYGGRGIQVCQHWLESFENFFADMGPRPSKRHSIDRVDNDKGYCKNNCRWATRSQQNRNTRSNVLNPQLVIAARELYNFGHWGPRRIAEYLGVPKSAVAHAVHYRSWKDV